MINAGLPLTSRVSIGLIFVFLMGCTSASPAVQTATYTNSEQGVAFQYPMTWHVSEYDRRIIFITSDESIMDEPRQAVKGQVAIALLLFEYSSTVLTNALEMTSLKPFGPPQKEPAHFITLNNQKFAVGTYDISKPESQGAPNFIAASVFDKRAIIVELYTAPEDESKYRRLFEEFLGSIRLTQQILLPFDWPPPPLTKEQADEVRACPLEALAAERYPEAVGVEQLRDAYLPQTTCDWAVLAAAHAVRAGYGETMPEPARYAFSRAVSNNYGFALATLLFYYYFDQLPVTKAPPVVDQTITGVTINYAWSGLGQPIDSYSVDIRQADTSRPIAASSDPALSIQPVDPAQIQALADRLTDLLPIQSQFTILPCFDNYPSWSMTLQFESGAQIEMTTRQSNFIFSGGPWQTEIEGQSYVQFSRAFTLAAIDLFKTLGLPRGEALGMACSADGVFDKAFPPTPGSGS